jgi:hypothetical protein
MSTDPRTTTYTALAETRGAMESVIAPTPRAASAVGTTLMGLKIKRVERDGVAVALSQPFGLDCRRHLGPSLLLPGRRGATETRDAW